MSDIRYNGWLHRSGTGGVWQDSSGRVGIGSSTPDQTLEVFKSSGANLVKVTSQANSTVGLEIEKTGATTQSWRIADGQTVNGSLEIYDVTDSRSVITLDGSGNMGLGGAPIAPGHLTFHMKNGTSSAATRFHMTTNTTGATATDGFSLSIDGSSSDVNLIQRETANMLLYTAGGERLRVRADGRVSIASSLAVAGVCTAATFVPTEGQLSNRNLIINGAMQVAQRNNSSSGNGMYTVDRFGFGFGGTDESPSQAQHQMGADDPGPWEEGFRTSYHITNGNQTGGAANSDHMYFSYAVEAKDIASSGWDYTEPTSYITLSYWVKSSVAQTFYGYLQTSDGTSRTYSLSTGALSANTWKKVTQKIPGHSGLTFNNDVGAGLYLYWIWPYAGTTRTTSGHTLNSWMTYDSANRMPDMASTWYTTNDATIEVTGMQLEVGSVATPFEHRSYGDEERKCQRYYQVIMSERDATYGSSARTGGLGGTPYTNDSNLFCPCIFPAPMRAKPTVVSSSTDTFRCRLGNNSNFDGFSGTNDHNQRSATFITTGVSNGDIGQYHWIETNGSTALLALNAEI